MARLLVAAGVVLVVLGLLLALAPRLPWLGRLPGDLRFGDPGFRVHLPLTSALLVSVVLTILLRLVLRR